jgi:hypothetical protein
LKRPPLSEQVLRALLPHCQTVPGPVHAVGLHLLAHRHPVLGPVAAICLKLLTHRGTVLRLLDAVGSELLAIHRLGPIGARLLTRSDALLRVHAVGSRLLTSGDTLLRPAVAGAHLLSARHPRLRAIGVGRARLFTHGEALRTLRPFDREALLALHPRRRLALHPRGRIGLPLRTLLGMAATPTAALECWLGTAAAMLAVRPRACRGCDRQRGDAGCEKDPGHKIDSFEQQNGPSGAPFPPLNGWNPHPIALA